LSGGMTNPRRIKLRNNQHVRASANVPLQDIESQPPRWVGWVHPSPRWWIFLRRSTTLREVLKQHGVACSLKRYTGFEILAAGPRHMASQLASGLEVIPIRASRPRIHPDAIDMILLKPVDQNWPQGSCGPHCGCKKIKRCPIPWLTDAGMQCS